jgi:asparagine synthase (glutamine-hydrolysing)
MCGICGIIRYDNKLVQEAPIRRMMGIMKHRGPDDEGVFVEENVGLGFVRLSIIDLSPTGHQPMISQDSRYVLIFNGEIYNYIELREELKKKGYAFKTQADSEVLLVSYIHWREECLHKFNGMWAFVIYDRQQKKLFGARDRYGIKPLYYSQTNKYLFFASEISPLISLFDSKAKPDYQMIYDYLVFNRTDHTDHTFFEDVNKLQPGHCFNLTLDFGSATNKEHTFSLKRWYNLKDNLKTPFQNSLEFRELFSASVGLRLRSDVPVGVSLSGGLDSSSIASILLKDYQKSDLNSFSAIYAKGECGDESEFIDQYKPLIRKMHFITPSPEGLYADIPVFIKAHEEPMPTTSSYAQFKVMELAKNHIVVNLSGQGADEQLAGYHYFFGFYFKGLLNSFKWLTLLKEGSAYLKTHKSLFGLKTFVYFLMTDSLKTSFRVSERGYLKNTFVKQYSHKSTIASGLYASANLHEALLDHFEYKLEHLLKWDDRNSMWFSLELRAPFLDYRLVERTLALPPEKIIRNGMTKQILREAMSGILPEKIRCRLDKIGFETPEAEWFRTPLFESYIRDILKSKSFRSRGLIIPETTEKLYQQHLNGKIDISKEIWKWINLELWFREFID